MISFCVRLIWKWDVIDLLALKSRSVGVVLLLRKKNDDIHYKRNGNDAIIALIK